MCGHRFKEHTKANHKCSNGNCKCAGFFYIIAEGAWILRCRCKHKHIEHDCTNLQHKCLKAGCKGCTGFDSPFVCNCDHQWSSHEQVAITITPSFEAMSAFSEVCGGGAGVQRGGVSLCDVPIALMGAAAPATLGQADSLCAVIKPPTATLSVKPPVPAPSAALSRAAPPPASVRQAPPPASVRHAQPLALSRSANDSSAAAPVAKPDAAAGTLQAAAAPSRIPSFSRTPSFGR